MKLLTILFVGSMLPIQSQTKTQEPPATPRTEATQPLTHGPFLGHVTPTTAKIWARCQNAGEHTCTLIEQSTNKQKTIQATAEAANDQCIVWNFNSLTPNSTYQYKISRSEESTAIRTDFRFATPPLDKQNKIVRIAFGSCAHEDAGTATVWRQVSELKPDAFVLLGDTPYIDSTKLATQRKRYREFAAVKEMGKLFQSTCMYGVWDDHDFGRNDTDGNLKHKENSRKAFVEYRANPSYGDGQTGIYTSFRRGPVEVFLLDTRYFAGTEKAESSPEKFSLLGSMQLKWLKQSLKDSRATFKVLACGMVWNGSVRPGKRDHWMTYPHEREELFRFIGQNGIRGVVLVAGDIHRSRVIRHATSKTVGYDLIELITSPMHAHVIPLANQPHPGLIFDAGEPHSFLLITANSEKRMLNCQTRNAAGKILHEESIQISNPGQK